MQCTPHLRADPPHNEEAPQVRGQLETNNPLESCSMKRLYQYELHTYIGGTSASAALCSRHLENVADGGD